MSTVSMTYDQLAARFGIGAKSARNLVRRKGWRRTQGNDGAARIDVPLEALPADGSTDAGTSGGSDAAPDAPMAPAADAGLVDSLRAEIAVLQSALVRAEAVAAERSTTLEHERRRAEEAQAELRAVLDRLLKLQEDAARPWWRRLAG